jgi:hypothetical protein
VTRTIIATDGGAATATVAAIDIDRTAPRVSAHGVHNGHTYRAALPTATCRAHDGGSGVASCRLTARARHNAIRYRATATDRAGNTSTVTGRYRIAPVYLVGARYRHGAYTIIPGHTYTLVARARRRPGYYDATIFPRRPRSFDKPMFRAGKNRWALGVTMAPHLDHHRLWNLGIKIGARMVVITVRTRGQQRSR